MLKTFVNHKAAKEFFNEQPFGHAILQGRCVTMTNCGGKTSPEASTFDRGYKNCSTKMVEYHDRVKHRSYRRV